MMSENVLAVNNDIILQHLQVNTNKISLKSGIVHQKEDSTMLDVLQMRLFKLNSLKLFMNQEI